MSKSTLLVIALLAIFPTLAYASTGTIEGTVKDSSAAALGGVAITAHNLETGQDARNVTTIGGTYRLAAVPPGVYRLTGELAGFATFTREPVRVYVGQTLEIAIVMAVAGLADEMTIEADTPLIATTRSEIAQVVEGERIKQLPLDGRDFLELAELAPGVAPSTGFGGGLTSISGSSFRNVADQSRRAGRHGRRCAGRVRLLHLRADPRIPGHHQSVLRRVRPLAIWRDQRRDQVRNERISRHRLRLRARRSARRQTFRL